MQDHLKYAPLSGAVQYANYVNKRRTKDKLPIDIADAMVLDLAIDNSIAVWGRFSEDFKAGVGELKDGFSSVSDIRKCLPVSSHDSSEHSDEPVGNYLLRRKAMKVIGFGNRRRKRSQEEIELYIQKVMYQKPEFNSSGRLVATKYYALNRQQAEEAAQDWVKKWHPYIRGSELLPAEKLLNCSAVEARLQALRWGKKEDRNDVNLVLLDRDSGSCAVLLDTRVIWRGGGRSEPSIVSSWPDGAELLFDLTDVAKVFGDEGGDVVVEPDSSDAGVQDMLANYDSVCLPKRTGAGAETINEYLRSGEVPSDFTVAQMVGWMLVQQDGAKGRALWRKKGDLFTRSDDVEIRRGGLRKAVQRYHDDIRFGETHTIASET